MCTEVQRRQRRLRGNEQGHGAGAARRTRRGASLEGRRGGRFRAVVLRDGTCGWELGREDSVGSTDLDGFELGCSLGCSLGRELGVSLGIEFGCPLGCEEGCELGTSLGFEEG
ncbi:hypothetical protein ACHAWF_017568 [Thalassiosira exigua]